MGLSRKNDWQQRAFATFTIAISLRMRTFCRNGQGLFDAIRSIDFHIWLKIAMTGSVYKNCKCSFR
jgi:hypothetical protein